MLRFEAKMFALTRAVLLVASLVDASQVVLSSNPKTGNVKYVLPTERTFLLNVPTSYKHGDALPLVLSFHGGRSLFFLLGVYLSKDQTDP